MTSRELDDVAARMADGEAIDWDGLESNARDASTRGLIRQLREIASISRAHALYSLDSYLTDTRVAAERASQETDTVPATWGGLRILGEIGRGRFGTVYRAWDPALDREVALKLLRSSDVPPLAPETESPDEALIVHEGRLMARIRHPNVVTIYGAQRIDGRTGIWMELVEGQTLEAELRLRGPFPPGEVAAVGIELCRALAAVHAAGLVHRDVKAQNVLREPTGRIALGDFGTGRQLDDLERDRGIAGTPAYLAPEIFRGEPATPRSDVYSLGTLLFLLGTGRFPVQGRTVREMRELHARGDRASTRDVRPDWPGPLVLTIDRALHPDPAERFDGATAMEHALHAAIPDPEAASPARADVTRAMGARGAMGFLAAVVVVAAGIAMYRSGGAQAPSSSLQPDDRSAIVAAAAVDASELPSDSISDAAIATAEEPGPPPPTAVALEQPAAAFRGRSGLVLTQIDPDFSRNIRIYNGVNTRRVMCTVRGRQAIQLCDLEAHTITDLRMPATKAERAEVPRLSPDGRHVAYAWHTGPLGALRVVASDGTDDRELVAPSAQWSFTDIKWMRDEAALLVRRADTLDGAGRLGYYVVPLDGGPMRPLWVGPASDARSDITPDGRFIVVDRPGASDDTDLAIIDVTTGREQPLLMGPASDSNASWTPDGSAIVYLSNSAGVRGLYMVRVAAGAVDGAPVLLHEFPRGTVSMVGFTSDGALFLERMTHWYNTFRARIDLAAGVASPPRRLDVRTTNEEMPGVSVNPLDGRIAYVAGGFDDLTAPARVVVLSVDGRLLERSLPLAGRAGRKSRVRWSPDGSLVAVSSSAGIEVLDVQRGTVTQVIDAAAWDHRWEPGGGAIYYALDSEIRRYDIELGTTTTVYRSAIPLTVTATFDVSPVDGALLLPVSGAVVIVRAGEPPQVRLVGGLIAALAWTPDGSRILVSSIGSSNPGVATLRILDGSDGPPVSVTIDAEPLTDLSLSADGQELFFAAGNQRPGYWVLTGFLQR